MGGIFQLDFVKISNNANLKHYKRGLTHGKHPKNIQVVWELSNTLLKRRTEII